MTNNFKPTIDLIKKECPGYSEDDIEKAIISFIESKSFEIILNLKLPPKKSIILSRTERFRQARSGARGFRQSERDLKLEFLNMLDSIREKLIESRETQTAITLTEHIQRIDTASTTLEGHLLSTDAYLATLIDEKSTSNERTSSNLKKLEQLSDNE